MRVLAEGWTDAEFADLHPTFAAALLPVVLEAQSQGIAVRRVSGWRSNAHQQHLRDTYEQALAQWQAAGGPATGKPKPLPASPPGHSAHNFTICSEDESHSTLGHDDECPKCGGKVVPASLAVDVGIKDLVTGNFIRVGGQIPREQRHMQWQRWATLLESHPELRDGGEFKNIDAVHCEAAGWHVADHTFHPDDMVVAVAAEPENGEEPVRAKRGGRRGR
jgi:hypothetical protein